MDINIDLSILETEPAAQYHAQADRYLSSHQLLDFIKCPWLHRKKAVGLVEDTVRIPVKSATESGVNRPLIPG